MPVYAFNFLFGFLSVKYKITPKTAVYAVERLLTGERSVLGCRAKGNKKAPTGRWCWLFSAFTTHSAEALVKCTVE